METLRTQDEIVQRFEERKKGDFLGFEVGEYLDYLDYEHAKPYLKKSVTSKEWEEETERPLPLNKKAILKRMLDYMGLAWEKANGCRGISASRSISHYQAWIWLAGDQELLQKVQDETNYEHYGKEILVMICDFYGWNSKQWDDQIRVNSESELESAIATKEANKA